MKFLPGLALAAICFSAAAQEQELQRQVQRALIQRDQQSAEFAARLRGYSLEPLHQRQLLELGTAQPPLSYQRERMAREREAFVLRLTPPVVVAPRTPAPLPLPRGPAHAVDPIPVQGFGG
jgi:hypothetical protein